MANLSIHTAMQSPEISLLEDAFAGLQLEEASSVSQNEDAECNDNPSFKIYQQLPGSSFSRPIFYRAVHSNSPADGPDGSLRARLFLPAALEATTKSNMRMHVENHSRLSNRTPTPFISATIDLLRAFNLAGRLIHEGEDQVAIILIDPWNVSIGSYLACNALRQKCGLEEMPIYETEIMIWAEVPAKSILARWTWSDLLLSGLFSSLPSLSSIRSGKTVEELRTEICYDQRSLRASQIAKALVFLGMNPSKFQSKQVFLFLLGQVAGHRVPRKLRSIEEELRNEYRFKLEEFDHAAHSIAVTAGKENLESYYKVEYSEDIKRMAPSQCPWGQPVDVKYLRLWRKSWALRINFLYCPGFEDWWVRREESDLLDWERVSMENYDAYGLRGW